MFSSFKVMNSKEVISETNGICCTEEIIGIIDSEKPDAVLIAGDVYDKSIPPSDAMTMFDNFLYLLSRRNLQVFIISGNHDSPERLSFGSNINKKTSKRSKRSSYLGFII